VCQLVPKLAPDCQRADLISSGTLPADRPPER
jgi:hypothetical protein